MLLNCFYNATDDRPKIAQKRTHSLRNNKSYRPVRSTGIKKLNEKKINNSKFKLFALFNKYFSI